MQAKTEKLLEELTLLSKIIHSCRAHFKELEKSDYENLKEQYAKFEETLKEAEMEEGKLKEFSIMRMEKKFDENQVEYSKKQLKNLSANISKTGPYAVAKNVENQCTPMKGPDLLNQDSTALEFH
jgi:hypothetical protein